MQIWSFDYWLDDWLAFWQEPPSKVVAQPKKAPQAVKKTSDSSEDTDDSDSDSDADKVYPLVCFMSFFAYCYFFEPIHT